MLPIHSHLHPNPKLQHPNQIRRRHKHVGLVSNNNEAPYREKVQRLSAWCRDNNLNFNTKQTNKQTNNHRHQEKKTTQHTGLSIDGEEVERVAESKFLGFHISEDLSWSPNTAHKIRKAPAALLLPENPEVQRTPSSSAGKLLPLDSRVSRHMAVLSGTLTAQKQRGRNCSGLLKQLSGL